MPLKNLPTLKIGDLEVNPPFVQGGMGVRVSRANLASAVANQGCVGVIAGVGLGKFEDLPGRDYVRVSEDALREEIRKARGQSHGVIGVNILVASSNYENLVRAAVDENVDLIISGAGLPIDLPRLANGSNVKLLPIVSSGKAFRIICKKWERNFKRRPDAVVVEGPRAGGHLGFTFQDVVDGGTPKLEDIVTEVCEAAKAFDPPIPVIAAGGIFDGADIARFLKLGASGVQMATRFVCTYECDVHDNFKQAYINAGEGDTTIIKSPVGMPGRAIMNDFVKQVTQGKTVPFKCTYRCLKSCDPTTAPYCICSVLAKAAEGNLDESFVFAGSNVYRCNEIVSVKTLIEKLTLETLSHLNADQA